MFTGRAELLDKGETTMEHTKNRQEEAEKLEGDKSNNHPTKGGLFGGLFRPKAPPLKPVIDIDDGVMRCPHCSWELEDGEDCAGCGYRYRSGSETDETESSDDDDNDDDDDDDDNDDDESESESDFDSDGMEDEGPEVPRSGFGSGGNTNVVWSRFANPPSDNGFNFGMYHPLTGFLGSAAMAPPGNHRFGVPPALVPRYPENYDQDEFDYEEDEEEEDYEDENEYDHEDSFINDGTQLTSGDYESDSDHSTVVTSSQRNDPHVRPSHQPSHIVSDTDGDHHSSGESDEEGDSDPDSDSGLNSDPSSGDSDSSDEDNIRAAPRRTWQVPSSSPWAQRMEEVPIPAETVDSSSTPDDSEPASSSPPRPAATTGPDTGRGFSAGNAIAVDDSDDDQPIGPVRRNTHKRRRRYSPY
jgi:hypothetical protein